MSKADRTELLLLFTKLSQFKTYALETVLFRLAVVSVFTSIHTKMHIDGKAGYSPSLENARRTDTKASLRW